MAEPRQPAGRDKYRVAIICALPREADAMDLLFDHIWDKHTGPDLYGPVTGGNNVYTYGRIGHVNVVLITLPRIGPVDAAISSSAIRSDFPNIVLGLVVGTCGGVPTIQGRDAFLGDVIVSSSVVRYDYGKQYDGGFSISKTPEDTLRRAPEGVSSIVAALKGERQRQRILATAATHLETLQAAAKSHRETSYEVPEASTDRQIHATYTHKHRSGCAKCGKANDRCDAAVLLRCNDIKVVCNPPDNMIRLGRVWRGPNLFVGRIGSGNTVMKSAKDRDRLAEQEDLIAFEMESAGAWEQFPCVMVKGICDYSDNHKNKDWQGFASATAASVARALIEKFVSYEANQQPISSESTERPVSVPDCEVEEYILEQKSDKPVGLNQRLLEEAPKRSGDVWGNNFGSGANVNTGTILGNGSWTNGHRRRGRSPEYAPASQRSL